MFVLLPAADTYLNARDWLMSGFDLTEDQALTLMTVACDFQVHQVVDGNCEYCRPHPQERAAVLGVNSTGVVLLVGPQDSLRT